VALQEQHDLLDRALLLPGSLNHFDAFARDAFNLAEARNVALDHFESLLFEVFNDTAGRDRADSFDQARAEIFLDTHDCRRSRDRVINHFELIAILWVRSPPPGHPQTLARRHGGEVSHHGHRLAAPRNFQAEHRVSVLFVVIGHAFDRAHKRQVSSLMILVA
jgi:hypothetical protein